MFKKRESFVRKSLKKDNRLFENVSKMSINFRKSVNENNSLIVQCYKYSIGKSYKLYSKSRNKITVVI